MLVPGTREETAMTQGFQQQEYGFGYALPKSAPTQYNGQKAAERVMPARPPRKKPRSGH